MAHLPRAAAEALAGLADEESLFAGRAAAKLERLQVELRPLAGRYDVVVANPPYMGGANMNKWLNQWVKAFYPNVKGDLCTCFIERVLRQLHTGGYAGLATSNSWMFLSSYEKLRKEIIGQHNIATLVQLSVHGFKGIAAQVCTFVLSEAKNEGMEGGYVRLNDFDHHSLQEEKTLEALADPGCGWFYRQSCSSFEAIPGLPIAYWIESSTLNAFSENKPMKCYAKTSKGLITGDNDEFFRFWWEIAFGIIGFGMESNEQSLKTDFNWFPLNKGGKFRKWYGNNEYVIHWADNGREVHEHAKATGHHSQDYDSKLKFKENISWSDISSGLANSRYRHNELSDHKGMPLYPLGISIEYCLGFLNSSVCAHFLSFLSPTLSCNIGEVEKLPVRVADQQFADDIHELVFYQIDCARHDWNCAEVSWDFKRHPLV